MSGGCPASDSTGVGFNSVMGDAANWLTPPDGTLPLDEAEAECSSGGESLSHCTPRFSGMQFGVTYAPDQSEDDNGHQNRYDAEGDLVDIISLGASYEGGFGGIGVGAGIGHTTATVTDALRAGNAKLTDSNHNDHDSAATKVDNPSAVNADVYVDINDIRVGVGYLDKEAAAEGGLTSVDGYDVGVRYEFGANSARVGYVALESDAGAESAAGEVAFARDLGPGVTRSVSLLWTDYDNSGSGTGSVTGSGYALNSGIKLQF